jgi:nucleoside-diphosphate-sugar epimerase
MDGLLRAASASTVGPATFNLATGTLHSVRQFVEIAGQALKVPATQFRFGALPQRPDEMAHEAVATKRLRGFLGWVPGTSIGAGAVATAAFLDRTAKPASA